VSKRNWFLIKRNADRISSTMRLSSIIGNIALFLTLILTLSVSDAQTPPLETPHLEMQMLATESRAADVGLIGVVALDFPVVNAEIVAKCSTGEAVSTRSANNGDFSLDVKSTQLPCMLEARGGFVDGAENQVVLHSTAYRLGVTNVTPLSELALAHAFAKSPIVKFSKLTSANFQTANLPSEAALQAGQDYVAQQLLANNIDLPPKDSIHVLMRKGDGVDKILSALTEMVALSQHKLVGLVEVAANKAPWAETLKPARVIWRWTQPNTLPEPLTPANNPMSNEKVELGRYLFYDVRLSGNQTFACASCHQQDKAFTDGKPLGVGSTGEAHPRGPMALGNVAYSPTLTWAHPDKRDLELQIDAPFFGDHPIEMGVNESNKAEILLRLMSDAKYPSRFKAAFPHQDNIVSWANVKKAIASFERTLLTGSSRYDKPHGKGTTLPWTEAEENGRVLFFTTANCFQCHGNYNFTDTAMQLGTPDPELRFHNTGLFNIGGTGAFPEKNRGIFELTGQANDMGKFKAPTLRNIAVTAPYMHDGSLATLADVLNFYGDHGRNITAGTNAGDGRANPHKSEHVNNIKLSEQDKADIIAFLKTLTDNEFLTNPKLSDPFKK
jgi:cytochrome c peroxidase